MTSDEQTEALVAAETKLELGPSAMARLLGISYQTYQNWRVGRRKMPPIAVRCLELVVATKGEL